MPQFRDVPVPDDPVTVRLQIDPVTARTLRVRAAETGISLAALCRIAMTRLGRGDAVTVEAILEEAAEIVRAHHKPAPSGTDEGAPKRSKGRPAGKKDSGPRRKKQPTPPTEPDPPPAGPLPAGPLPRKRGRKKESNQ